MSWASGAGTVPLPAAELPSWLPSWALVSPGRLAHIERVTELLERWASELGLEERELAAWRDAGRLHDAMRDADEPTLRALTRDEVTPVDMLHGPAAAVRLLADGETRGDLLAAIRHHTIGSADWARLGRALYMADYLEPGRSFDEEERSRLAEAVPTRFDQVFREVLRMRIQWGLRCGYPLFPATVELWNQGCASEPAG